ncbi:hypothetical protein [Methylorubrum extorquens]|uniref:Capsule polysaccharide biosynthesis protein n=1 Tax=Methylorubrum extorquens (strain CM4 / NCIMB 13688) TaxID=440085 RepID=B7KYP1_METC4|nr:hypothetical protein [Methylorubrum extorquens]ACK84792.1 hypothetical protein Mchl_3987 [Methylorubrum extorquens CM4]
MTPFDFFNAVQRVQKEFDLSRLTLGGVNHWMVVRLLMLSNLASLAARSTRALVGMQSHSRMIDNPLAQLSQSSTKLAYYSKRIVDRSAILFEPPGTDSTPGKMVFYELPVDYTQVIGGSAVNRIADGFVEAFGSQVRKVCRFDFGLARSASRIDPTYVFIAPGEIQAPAEDRRRFLRAVRDLCRFLDLHAPDFSISPAQILRSMTQVLSQAEAHDAWLEAVDPKIVAFQCYVSMEKMALLVACKRRGIPTLEVQHGYCDASSIFNDMPSFGSKTISLLPDVFWAWGPMTRDALRSDPGFRRNDIRVALGGDVWGALANGRAANEVGTFLEQVAAHRYTRRIMVGHQVESLMRTGESDLVVPQLLIDAMRAGSSSWLWLIRVHPRSSHLIEPIQKTFVDLGIANFELIHSTITPIEIVFEAADCYVTGFSVSAFEANTIGKPVIIIDEIGRQLFAPLVEADMFKAAATGAELVRHVKQLERPAGDAGYYCRDLALARKTFEAVMRGEQPDGVAETAPVALDFEGVAADETIPVIPDPALIQSAAEQVS